MRFRIYENKFEVLLEDIPFKQIKTQSTFGIMIGKCEDFPKSYLIAEDESLERINVDWQQVVKELKPMLNRSMSIETIQDFLSNNTSEKDKGKIKSHKQASEVLQVYSNFINDLMRRKQQMNFKESGGVREKILDLKNFDNSLSKYFVKMDQKASKFDEQERKFIQKLRKNYDELKPLKTKVFEEYKDVVNQINDVWEVGSMKKMANDDNSFSNMMKLGSFNGGQQYQQQMLMKQQNKPIVNKWTKSTVNVEKQIAVETKEELLKVESEFDELTEMVKDFNILVKEQGESIKEIKKNVSDANANVIDGVQNLKGAKKYQRFGLG